MIKRLNISLGIDETYNRDMSDFTAKQNETNLIIILSRTQNRLILNEEELRHKLSTEYGYEAIFVRNEDHSFAEQIALLRRARIVLAMHGSILVMTMFCRRGNVF
jgi:protein O-mannose beta-1,4-N-acetylglucosaminyltransferase